MIDAGRKDIMMVGKKMMQNIKINPLVLVIFCVFLYPPKLLSVSFLLPAIVYGVSIIYVILNWKVLSSACFRQRKVIFSVLALFLFSLIIPLINATNDFSFSFSSIGFFFKKGIVYLFLLCFILKKYGSDGLLHRFLYYFAITHVAYVIGTLILVLFPSFQNFWFSIFNKEAADVLLRSSGYTFRLGWQGFAGFVLTMKCTFSVIFLLFLRFGTKPQMINVRQFAIPFVVCIVGNMFYGRIGLIITIIVAAIAILFWNRKHLGRIVLLAGLGAVLIFTVNILKNQPFFSSWYDWMSKPIVNLVNSGEFNDKSFDRLQEMNQVEISPDTFLFGDALYKIEEHSYMDTDAGFVRNVLFWGIFGAILSYGLTLYSIVGLRRISRMMALQLLIAFFAFEYKGAAYYEFITIAFILMVAFYLTGGKFQKKQINNTGDVGADLLINEGK